MLHPFESSRPGPQHLPLSDHGRAQAVARLMLVEVARCDGQPAPGAQQGQRLQVLTCMARLRIHVGC
jgi:hypothetical protein